MQGGADLEGSVDRRAPSPPEKERPNLAELIAKPPRHPPVPHILSKPVPLVLHINQ